MSVNPLANSSPPASRAAIVRLMLASVSKSRFCPAFKAVVDLAGKDYNDGKGSLARLLQDPAQAPLLAHLRGADGQ